MGRNRYIRFDWAAKYMLRNKADFAIFEGLISVLVHDKVTIVELLDTESNKETKERGASGLRGVYGQRTRCP